MPPTHEANTPRDADRAFANGDGILAPIRASRGWIVALVAAPSDPARLDGGRGTAS